MDLGTEGSDPRSPSMRHPTDQPPCQQNSFKERGSDVAEKPLEGKEETFSVLRESCTQRQGSVPKTDENSKETELKRDSGISGSESEGSRKREIRSSLSSYDDGAAPGDGGRSGRSRHRSPGQRPPPLRKRLVSTLRALSEAICQDVAQACEQQEQCPLTWEQRSGLGELWAPLDAALQAVYAMANQAAYVFPAESWLVPGPPPAPGLPLGVGEMPGGPGGGIRARARLPSWVGRAAPGVRAEPCHGSESPPDEQGVFQTQGVSK
ncbi:protein FRG2-like-1 [Halichoerus grypus]|uniref:protein FRG2-like-1 n=1 Tax=Halichoerus grypus TaxID=9711 RepID=UPI001659F61C|nr:protein FRG2-like-1 [Halichoerus grypus]